MIHLTFAWKKQTKLNRSSTVFIFSLYFMLLFFFLLSVHVNISRRRFFFSEFFFLLMVDKTGNLKKEDVKINGENQNVEIKMMEFESLFSTYWVQIYKYLSKIFSNFIFSSSLRLSVANFFLWVWFGLTLWELSVNRIYTVAHTSIHFRQIHSWNQTKSHNNKHVAKVFLFFFSLHCFASHLTLICTSFAVFFLSCSANVYANLFVFCIVVDLKPVYLFLFSALMYIPVYVWVLHTTTNIS